MLPNSYLYSCGEIESDTISVFKPIRCPILLPLTCNLGAWQYAVRAIPVFCILRSWEHPQRVVPYGLTNPRFIMYLTFIVYAGKMRIKNSYVLRGLRHPLGEIIMNEYE